MKFEKGMDYYFGLFQVPETTNGIIGEIAPTYFSNREALNRINSLGNNTKIIIGYRNPIEKAISLYQHHLSKGRVSNNFKAAAGKFKEILEAGRYSYWIPLWKEKFGNDNVLVLNFEDIHANPKMYMKNLHEFLELPIYTKYSDEINPVNQASYPLFPRLAKIIAKGATWLRKNDLHYIANVGKKIGLAKFYKGGPQGKMKISDADLLWLNNQFSENDFIEFE